MRFTTAALILPLAVSSFAAELPDKTISISYLKTTVRKDTLEMHEVSLIAEVAEEEKTFYCESKGNETPEYPDTVCGNIHFRSLSNEFSMVLSLN